MKVIVPIPVNGRLPLVRLTVKRLYEKNKVDKVILMGHEPQLKKLAYDMDCVWVETANNPLGLKWNLGFMAAKRFNPDAVLFVGSSDWVSEDYLPICEQYIDQYEMIGKLGCHFADKRDNKIRLVEWKGYGTGVRANESIGIGRLLSSRILDKFGWMPFNSRLDNSMDWSMQQNVIQHKGRIKILPSDQGSLLSISCDKWHNKHIFDDHWLNRLPSTRMNPFPFLDQFNEISEL